MNKPLVVGGEIALTFGLGLMIAGIHEVGEEPARLTSSTNPRAIKQ